jgi:hypothetical protein
MHKPNYGSDPSEKIEAFICYDSDYLYFAAKLYDSEVDKIESSSKKRDADNPNSQWFGIALDTFNDNENAVAFFTTPSGLRWDAQIINDSQGNVITESSWNTYWDVEVSRNEEGWFAEFRIPFSSLRFKDENGKVEMGMITWRLIPRKVEWSIFPNIPPNWGGRSFYKISEAADIVFEDLHSRSPLYVSPFLLVGFDSNNILNKTGDSYEKNNKNEYEAGIDIKYGISSNLTLDVTINTDFAQVEADDQQINLTRFSLFFPEKRLFFLERSNIFDFTFEAKESNKLFYSRRIGIKNGNPVRIYGGMRLIGRIGSLDLGFINMQTASLENSPSENFGVLRLKKQVFNEHSYIGTISTSVIGDDGSYNTTYGLEGLFRFWDDKYFTLMWAQSFENENQNKFFSLDPSRLRINFQRRSEKDFGYETSFSYAGKNFNPGIGFEIRENYSRYSAGIWYGWFPSDRSIFFKHKNKISGDLILENDNRTVESAKINENWRFETRAGYNLTFDYSFNYEAVKEDFPISKDIDITKGEYKFSVYSLFVETPFGTEFSTSAGFTAGKYFGGNRYTFSLDPVWSVSSSLELTANYQINKILFNEINRDFNSHLLRIKLLYMFNTKISASAFFQYNSTADIALLNFRFRYNPGEGIDLYLVYNENFNLNRFTEIPVLPISKNRTILLKFTNAFEL